MIDVHQSSILKNRNGAYCMNDTVAEKVRDMKSGREEAFDWLYFAYAKKLYGMAFFITGSKPDSEDIVQETFVKCYLRKDTIQDEQAFEAWLYRILVRTAWRYQKHQKPSDSLEGLAEDGREGEFEKWVQTDCRTVLPLEEVIRKEENHSIYQAVRQLEIKQRTVILLYYFNQLSVAEIASITGSFTGTIKSRLFKARQNLRKILEKPNEESNTQVRRGIRE